MIEGLSKYFGDHPVWFYVGAFMPAIFTVLYPFVLYSMYFYTSEMWKQNRSPEMMYSVIFYIAFFSIIIGHKEKRFMLPIVPFCFLATGYMLVRKIKTWKGKATCLVWASVIVEIIVQCVYGGHHNLHVLTDHILAKGGTQNYPIDYHPSSLYTMKRFDQPWYSLLHTPDVEKRT